MADLDLRIKKVEAVYTKVSSIPKPKEAVKGNKNIKIDNITIDGNSDVNWEDFIKIDNPETEDETDTSEKGAEE